MICKNCNQEIKLDWDNYRDMNKIVEKRVLWFRDDDIFGTLRVMEHRAGGQIVPLEIHDVTSLHKLVSKFKRPVDDERIKKMGIKIAELNKKLKEK